MIIQQKFQHFRTALSNSLVERDPEIDLVLIGLIAKENALLVGVPGVAKSQMIEGVARWMDTRVFSYLLTKFTDPMELFGPIDLQSLKNGENKRNVAGYAPTASFLFLDELFKSSSAILNTLLKLLNEKVFKYGIQEMSVPLIQAVAASNEWPNAETMQELGALFDRFLLRKKVRPVSVAGRKVLLSRAMADDDFRPKITEKISPEEIEEAHQEAMDLTWTSETEEALHSILDELNHDGIFPGDRRLVKCTKIFRAKAWLDGAEEVLPEHLEVLSHVLWVDPQEQPEHAEKIVTKIANPLGAILYDYQQQIFNVEEKANEKLKTIVKSDDKRKVVEEVINIAREIEREIRTRKDTPLKLKILNYVTESRKNWDRKLHQLPPR